jgi:hypothetical protein
VKTLVRVTGGLGNQLFQLAHAFDVRNAGFGPVALDTGWFRRPNRGDTPRTYELDRVDHGFRTVDLPFPLWSSKVGLAHTEVKRGLPSRALGLVTGIQLDLGWWQSWSQVERVRHDMTSILLESRAGLEALPPLRSNVVGVHIRLGDFAEVKYVRDVHGATDALSAIDRGVALANEIGASGMLIFTDDAAAIKPLVAGLADVEVSEDAGAWDALHRLSTCRAILMSNSTLSWWSALLASWLDESPMLVQMPVPWFTQPSSHDSLMRAPGWATYTRVLQLDE